MGSGGFVELKTIEVTSADGDKRILYGKRVVIKHGRPFDHRSYARPA